MKFVEYCKYLEKLQNSPGRNSKTEILADLFSQLKPQEVRQALYLLDGRIAAKYQAVEFNFSTKLMITAIQNYCVNNGVLISVKDRYDSFGDIGELAANIRAEVGPAGGSGIDIFKLHSRLKDIAKVSGKGAQAEKSRIYIEFFETQTPLEAKYLARIIVGNLRLGMSEKTIIDALSWFKVKDKSLKKLIERAMGVRSDIGLIAEDVLSTDITELELKFEKYTIIPGVPVASKLVEREKSPQAVFERISSGYIQPKLDGLRAQVHKWVQNDEVCVSIFSRNFENITEMFPDLVEAGKRIPVDSFVFDSEVVGFDFDNQKMMPFQDTIQRKRKHDVGNVSKTIPVRSMMFDVLSFEGQDLSRLPIKTRLQYLDRMDDKTKEISKLETIQFDEQEKLVNFFEACLEKGLEGVIIKKDETKYEPGTRNFDWIKLKASSKKELVDTIDAVVMGYYFGTGARNKFGLGAILIGVFNQEEDRYETVAKVGTGITDDLFVTIKRDLMGITMNKKSEKYLINNNLLPDVFVDPKIVVEVEADELTLSNSHTACKTIIGDKGISMRFPRLKVWDRDKNPEQATSTDELYRIYDLRKKK